MKSILLLGGKMLQLFNYCPMPRAYEQNSEDLQGFLQKNNLHGIELFLYSKERNFNSLKPWVKGVHLRYWPYWLDFWQAKTPELSKYFPDSVQQIEYYWGATNCTEWLEVIRHNIRLALEEQPEYLVWHVANCDLEEAFTFEFKHTDVEVMQATVEVFNAVSDCIPEHVHVLFENLWWPGLRLTEPQLVEKFFEQIKHKNSGIMLDLGHLMNTNQQLTSEEQGYAYAQSIIRNLGETAARIKGVHLNHSLSGEYVLNLNKQVPERFYVGDLYEHVTKIDQHLACRHTSIAELIELINPSYLVHELFYDNLEDMQNKIKIQQKALRGE